VWRYEGCSKELQILGVVQICLYRLRCECK